MKDNRLFLLISILLAIFGHVLFIIFVSNVPIHAMRHETKLASLSFKYQNGILEEIFKEMEEIKDSLSSEEVKEEIPPQFTICFPKKELFTDFSFFEAPSPKFDTHQTWLTFDSDESFIASEKMDLELPPNLEFSFEDENYDSFAPLHGSDDFDLQVEYAPRQSKPGYIFKVTLFCHPESKLKRLKQNYFFILDRSNSMAKSRYAWNKKGVAEALEFLNEEDCFNIYVFDSHVVRFSEIPLIASKQNCERAIEFLDKQSHGGFFAATELYSSLGKIIPSYLPENEVNTAILLSDGDTYLSLVKQRMTIGGWTFKNRGKVSLYCAATGTGNNLTLMELLSAFNKGHLIYGSDHTQIVDRLKQFMRSIQNPIGKQIVATAISDEQTHIILQPNKNRLPELYQNRPYVLYGSTNRLTDFTLFLQGKYLNRLFDIKKHICLKEATLGSFNLERQWATLVSQEYYEKYFEDGNTQHLEKAKQLLAPLNLSTPFLE